MTTSSLHVTTVPTVSSLPCTTTPTLPTPTISSDISDSASFLSQKSVIEITDSPVKLNP